jgi:hypothetical protein
MSTLKTINIVHPSGTINNIVNDASGNVAVGGTVGMASSFKRNILINGNFLINQRVYVSGTATASGTYMHDRWKSTTTSSNYTFTQGTPDTTITIAAGTIAQIVENVNVAGGIYTLSWTGTATARIAINGASTSGSYAASPITTSSATAGQQITVEFSTGTLGLVQLEPGTKASIYERQIYSDQLAQCQRYFQTVGGVNSASWAATQLSGSSNSTAYITFSVTMRVAPTLTVIGTGFNAQDNSLGPSTATISSNTAAPFGSYLAYSHSTLTSNATRRLSFSDSSSYLQFSAEL